MSDLIDRQEAIDALMYYTDFTKDVNYADNATLLFQDSAIEQIRELPAAQPEQEDYTEMKREFLRMASYIDCLLVCSDEQKETLMNFISRLAEYMPWTKRD